MKASRRSGRQDLESRDKKLLRLIAAFKFLKAALLIAASVGIFRLLHKDLGAVVQHWIEALRLNPGNRHVEMALGKICSLTPSQIKKLGLGGVLYATLFLIEGTGLWLLKPWAEWVTTIITSTLIPLEIYEIYRHPTAVKVLVLVVNIATVWYLIHRIRMRRHGRRDEGEYRRAA